MNDVEDWRPMVEDVSLHTMTGFFIHSDKRGCVFHQRLGIWVFNMIPTYECLRNHQENQ